MTARFLNVDLLIRGSRSDIAALTSRLESRTSVLRSENGFAAFELPFRSGATLEDTLRRLCDLLESLPPAQKRVWKGARSRQLDIGVEAGSSQTAGRFSVPPKLLGRIAKMNADLVFTVYRTDETPRRGRKR